VNRPAEVAKASLQALYVKLQFRLIPNQALVVLEAKSNWRSVRAFDLCKVDGKAPIIQEWLVDIEGLKFQVARNGHRDKRDVAQIDKSRGVFIADSKYPGDLGRCGRTATDNA
jgi:hypothetical protein